MSHIAQLAISIRAVEDSIVSKSPTTHFMTSALLLVIVPSASVIAVPVGSFGNVTDVGDAVNDPPNLAGAQFEPSISPDGLKLYYTQGHPERGGGWRIYQASRPTTSEPFIICDVKC